MTIQECLSLSALIGLLLVGCTSEQPEVAIDGSSTVFPITEAVADEFRQKNASIRVTVGVSGTGGGFKKFCAGEIDINDASRPIKEKEEKIADENKIGYIELPVAFDGLSVVVNKANTFVDYLSIDELNQIWSRDGKFRTWKDVRPNWPDRPIKLYGPGTASGTFDYFVEAVLGKKGEPIPFTSNEDDNVIVKGVAGDPDALGFFGYAYFAENQDRLNVVPIKHGDKDPVPPSLTTINNGTYSPLSRPIFIYVSAESRNRPEIQEFVNFYLDNAAQLSQAVGYVALPQPAYAAAKARFTGGVTGSIFRDAEAGTDIETLMQRYR